MSCRITCLPVVLGAGALLHTAVVGQGVTDVRRLAFTHLTVIDVANGRLYRDRTVVIAGNRVQAIDTSTTRVPRGTRVVDARGKYAIPGLWDIHTHLWGHPNVVYPLLLANGITGIRDVGTGVPLDTLRQWRRDVLAGTRVGPPRQLFAGPGLDEQASVFDCRLVCFEQRQPYVGLVEPARARAVVDSVKAAGADFLKVHHILSMAIYYAVVAEAKRVGIPFAGHVPGGRDDIATLLEASDSGQHTFEHMPAWAPCSSDSATVDACAPIAKHLVRNGSWISLGPVWRSSRLTERQRIARLRYWPDSLTRDFKTPADSELDKAPTHFSRLHLDVAERAGLPLLIGTDAGPPTEVAFPGFETHDDMTFYVDHGLSPLAALQAVTLNPAKAFGLADSLGTVAPGKLADVVLLDASPLTDIANTSKIWAVVANGRYFDRAALDQLLAELERHGSPRWAALGSGQQP